MPKTDSQKIIYREQQDNTKVDTNRQRPKVAHTIFRNKIGQFTDSNRLENLL